MKFLRWLQTNRKGWPIESLLYWQEHVSSSGVSCATGQPIWSDLKNNRLFQRICCAAGNAERSLSVGGVRVSRPQRRFWLQRKDRGFLGAKGNGEKPPKIQEWVRTNLRLQPEGGLKAADILEWWSIAEKRGEEEAIVQPKWFQIRPSPRWSFWEFQFWFSAVSLKDSGHATTIALSHSLS